MAEGVREANTPENAGFEFHSVGWSRLEFETPDPTGTTILCVGCSDELLATDGVGPGARVPGFEPVGEHGRATEIEWWHWRPAAAWRGIV